MKKTAFCTVLVLIAFFGNSQCRMVYVKKTFTKVEYYTNTKDSLKLEREAYSTNSIEITKNTSDQRGDIFSASGSLVGGEKYVGFISQYECKNVAGQTKYTLYTNDGRTEDTWIIYVKLNGEVSQASFISAKENMCLTFRE